MTVCKFIGGPEQFTDREMDVDTNVRTYELYHRGKYYPYDKQTSVYYEAGMAIPIETISYKLR